MDVSGQASRGRFLFSKFPNVTLFLCFSVLLSSTLPGISGITRQAVYDIVPQTESQLKVLTSLIDKFNIDVWRRHARYGANAGFSLLLDTRRHKQILPVIRDADMMHSIRINDVHRLINKQHIARKRDNARRRCRRSGVGGRSLHQYHTSGEIYEILQSLEVRCSVCTIKQIGSTFEGRRLLVFKISPNENDVFETTSRPALFIDAGLHAREWIAPATLIYIIHQLLNELLHNNETTASLRQFDWYFLPVANPDGYDYSFRAPSTRLWRKNRSRSVSLDRNVTSTGACIGVDLNRNFGFHWGEFGSSHDPCSEVYAGRQPFSEQESWSLRRFLMATPSVMTYLSLHSYGQEWSYPWGYGNCGKGRANDETDMREVAMAATDAIYNLTGTDYKIGQSSCLVYPAAGVSHDWAKGVAHIKYAYIVELPDDGYYYGFLLPPTEIQRVGKETWLGVKAMVAKLSEKHYLWQGNM